jgi:hypothetical protein
MNSDLKKLEVGIELMKNIQKLEEHDAASTCYVNVSKNADEANHLFSFSSTRLNEAKNQFNELCTYLGEPPDIEPEQLFSTIIYFVSVSIYLLI